MRTYTGGEWGKTTTTLDDAKDIDDLYHRLTIQGFVSYTELICRTGEVRLYYRQSTTNKKILPFDYCCVLYISGYVSTILLPDLPDVFQLMREIDGQPKKRETATVRVSNVAELKNVLQQIVIILNDIKNYGIFIKAASATNNSQQIDETTSDFDDLSFP
jgi:hypothetical protein